MRIALARLADAGGLVTTLSLVAAVVGVACSSTAATDAPLTRVADGGTTTTNTDAGSDTPDGGTAPCGCNGAAGCAVWTNVYVTFYGYNDNSCDEESAHSCNDIAYPGLGPQKHQGATEGAGTYDDPITAAASDQGYETSGGATLDPGTLVYNPIVQKYFIMEDSCLECGDEWNCHVSSDDTSDGEQPPADCKKNTNLHIDFWMGPSSAQDGSDLDDCEGNSTVGSPYDGVGTVVVNPPPNLPVAAAKLYSGTGSKGGCWTSTQVSAVACP